MSEKKEITILAIESSCDETGRRLYVMEEPFFLILFLPRLTCTSCTEGWCRKLPPGNILRRSIR